MRTATFGLLIVLLVAGCTASPASRAEPSPLPEASRAAELAFWGDGFYEIPDPFASAERGSLVRVTMRYQQDDARMYRMMYHSTSVDGQADVALTGAIWVPSSAAPDGGFPIVAWAPMFDGVGDDCAYSRNPSHRPFDEVMTSLLADGFVVAVTDYEGHGTAYQYLDGIPESGTHAVLDAARAAQDLLGPLVSDDVVVVGHGLGGWVVSQSLNYLEAYADTLHIHGVVVIDGGGDPAVTAAGVAGPDDVGVLDTLRAVRAYAAAYPELGVEDVLTPKGVQLVNSLHEDGCVPFPELDNVRVLDVSNVDVMGVEPWAERIRAHSPHKAPYPALYVVGREAWVPVEVVTDVVDKLCQISDQVELREYAAPTHDSVIASAYHDWGQWIQQRITSDDPVNGC